MMSAYFLKLTVCICSTSAFSASRAARDSASASIFWRIEAACSVSAFGDVGGGIQRNQAVFDVVQGKTEMLHGQDLMELDQILVGIESSAALAFPRRRQKAFPVVILQGADGDAHLLAAWPTVIYPCGMARLFGMFNTSVV